MASHERAPDHDGAHEQRREVSQAQDPGAGKQTRSGQLSGGSRRELPPDVRAKMEAALGADFSAVRIHEGPEAAAAGARAYAQGSDLYFAPGEYDPYSPAGQELLGHELAHVVQQAQGRVSAPGQAKDAGGTGAINDDASLEREADDLGARAARGERGGGTGAAITALPGSSVAPIQCKKATDTARERSITLDERPLHGGPPSATGPKATVMDPDKNPGKSLAADPAREAQNEEFERRLGIAAFNDPRANAAAGQLCAKIEAYLDARSDSLGSKDDFQKYAMEIAQRLSGEKNFAGTVTQPLKSGDLKAQEEHAQVQLAALQEVIHQGNLRERMSLVDQFMKQLGREFSAATGDKEKFKQFLATVEAAGMDPHAFEQAAEASGKSLTDETVDSSITSEPRDQARVASNKPNPKTALTPHDLRHTPLSPRERRHQGELEKEAGRRPDSLLQQGYNRPLHFTEGARYFLVNEQSKWAEQLRALSLPLKAGPSGHTDMFFRANQLFGAGLDPDTVRLLAIGHLLPIRAHSLIEILDVAAKWGCALKLDGDLYKRIAPYSEDELRIIAGGKLPGEAPELEKFKPWDVTDMLEEHRSDALDAQQDPELVEVLKARHDRQGAELAQLDGELEPVTTLLEDKPTREALEEHVYQPKLSTNVRDALELAREVSEREEPAARKAVEARLVQLGFDLEKQPDLYDLIVERVRQAPVTINLRTNIIEELLRGGEYQNQWERSIHPSKGEKSFHGGGKYAIDRNETEKTLHNLPEMEEAGEAASEISPGWDERNKAGVAALQQKLDALPKMKEQQGALTKEIAALGETIQQMHTKAGSSSVEQAKLISERVASLMLQRTAKEQQLAQLGQDILKLEAELPSLKLSLAQAKLEAQLGKGTIRNTPTDEHGFRERRSGVTDRPHSAAVNGSYRAGSAPKSTYGTSHLVMRDDVRDRSTVTGGDSLEQVWKPNQKTPEQALAQVGTFQHLGAVLAKVQPDTLRMLAEEASNPDQARTHRKGFSETNLYLEVQVFGAIKMSRDVAKIVIDEDDLDAWEAGNLVDYYNKKIPARTRDEVKRRIEGYARAYGIDVQYIRTGATTKPGGMGAIRGAGPHLGARRQGWEETGEAVLRAFRAGNWATGLSLSEGASDLGKGSMFGPSYEKSGITALAGAMTRLQQAGQGTVKYTEEQLMKLAADALQAFYASPFSPDHLEELERVLGNCIFALRACVDRSLSPEVKQQDHNQEQRPGVDTELLKRLNDERGRKKPESSAPERDPTQTETPSVTPGKGAETTSDKGTAKGSGGSGASGASGGQEVPGINHDYQYEDIDMYRVLTLMVEEAGLGNVHVVPPCDNIVGEQLRTRLQENAQQYANQARTVLVPYNLGNYHWVGICIEVGINETNVRVWYMDPLRGRRPAPRSVENEVRQVYAQAAFPVATRMMQPDGTSCGPVTIRNLMLRAQQQAPVQDQLMDHDAIEQLRQEHVDSVNGSDEPGDFEARQRENRSSVRSVFDVQAYLAKSGNTSFSPREYQRILQIIDSISKLGEEARTAIWAAFSSINKNPSMDNAFYFQALRKALHTSFQIVQQGNQLPERQLMDGILQSLWGITFDQAAAVASFDDATRFKFRDFEEMKAIGTQLGRDENRDKVLAALTKTIEEQEAAMKKLTGKSGKQD